MALADTGRMGSTRSNTNLRIVSTKGFCNLESVSRLDTIYTLARPDTLYEREDKRI